MAAFQCSLRRSEYNLLMHMKRLLPFFAMLGLLSVGMVAKASPPEWIWVSEEPADGETCIFKRSFEVGDDLESATLRAVADNSFKATLDGREVARGDNWKQLVVVDLIDQLSPGTHVLEVECRNGNGPAGFAAILELESASGTTRIVSDERWLVQDGETWRAPFSFGATDEPNKDWPDPFQERTATSASAISVPEGFEIDLIHSAQPGEGSWSAMCLDEQGRVIVSPQYGPLRRIEIPETAGEPAKVETLHPTLGRAHGLLVVDGSLYANVADRASGDGGLWRLRDEDGDDRYETVDRLATYNGGSEHGPHGLALGPDGMLWMINGNMTALPSSLSEASPHRDWAEDIVVERSWDPRGHAVNLMSPGGVLLRTDLDGRSFEIMAGGMRNPYDIAFNADGEVFTYDADMEWDIGTPWYRTPRLLHLVSGAEYGWRSGSAKWPVDSAESRPAVAELDAGSPTGVASAHESAFPEPWRSRMYLADWAYGRVLAVDLVPDGASYVSETHDFLLGRPFNVTDLAFAPGGDLYVTIGGRGSQAGLYRVRWVGTDAPDDSRKPIDARAAGLREYRKELEQSHVSLDAVEVDELLEGLGHGDEAIRYASRIGLEHRLAEGDVEWFEAGLDLPADAGGWETAIAGMRAGSITEAMNALDRMGDMADEDDTPRGRRYFARTLVLLIARHGPLDPPTRDRVLELLEDRYPTGEFSTDRHLVEVLVALKSPMVPEATMPLVEQAANQEEAIHYLHALRLQDEGWTDDTRDRAVQALMQARTYAGGASLKGFVDGASKGLLARLGPESLNRFNDLLLNQAVATEDAVARPFVRSWVMEEIEPHLPRTYASRNFARGRDLYVSLQCAACHKFGEVGDAYGPDLGSVGGRFSPRDLLISMLDPHRDLSDQYAAVEVTLDDGEMVVGLAAREDEKTLVLAPDPRTGKLAIEVPKSSIVERRETTTMPAALLDTCTIDEVLDLLAYLVTAGNDQDSVFSTPP